MTRGSMKRSLDLVQRAVISALVAVVFGTFAPSSPLTWRSVAIKIFHISASWAFDHERRPRSGHRGKQFC